MPIPPSELRRTVTPAGGKNNETYYSYKNHAKVDLKSKLIIKSITTPAQVHDSQVFKGLLDKKDRAVLADSAYYSGENEAFVIEELDAEELLMGKANKNSALREQEVRSNHTISRMRVRVEHVFGRMRRWEPSFAGASASTEPPVTTSFAISPTTWSAYALLMR